MEHPRVLAFIAAVLGITAAIVLSDGWWFMLGVMAFTVLLLSGEEQAQ
ncbi:hypothetical protein ABZ863_12320 [Saccharomonospora sp. NPDC046836]